MNIKLKFKILETFGTQARFAHSCGKGDNWVSRIVTGRQIPTPQEKKIICKNLNIEKIDSYLSCPTEVVNH